MSPRALVCLVDQSHDPRAVVDADRWRRAPPPVIERITHCGEIRRGDVGAREGFVFLGGGELYDPVLHCENGVAAGYLPLTVSAVTRKAIADLDGTKNAARGAQHHRSVVLDRTFMRAPAQLRASYLPLLPSQIEEHVQPVRAIPEAAAAGLGGPEHAGCNLDRLTEVSFQAGKIVDCIGIGWRNIRHDYAGSGLARLYEMARRVFTVLQTSVAILLKVRRKMPSALTRSNQVIKCRLCIKSWADALANLPSRARWFPQGDAAIRQRNGSCDRQPSSVNRWRVFLCRI